MSAAAPGGLNWRAFTVGPDLLVGVAVLYCLHELLHLGMIRLAGLHWAEIEFAFSWRVLRMTLKRPPGRGAFVAIALAPLVLLSVVLLVPLRATGDPFWLVLLVIHTTSCSEDLLSTIGLMGRHKATNALDDTLVPTLTILVLLPLIGMGLGRIPTSAWLRADQLLPLNDIDRPLRPGTARVETWTWVFRAAGARRLKLTWRERKAGELLCEEELELPLSRSHGSLTIRLGPTTERQGEAIVQAFLEGGRARLLAPIAADIWRDALSLRFLEPETFPLDKELPLGRFLADPRVDELLDQATGDGDAFLADLNAYAREATIARSAELTVIALP